MPFLSEYNNLIFPPNNVDNKYAIRELIISFCIKSTGQNNLFFISSENIILLYIEILIKYCKSDLYKSPTNEFSRS